MFQNIDAGKKKRGHFNVAINQRDEFMSVASKEIQVEPGMIYIFSFKAIYQA